MIEFLATAPADSRPRDDGSATARPDDESVAWRDLSGEYACRFGRPFIVRAAGRSTAEITAILQTRLGNDVETEERVVATQSRQITLLALSKRVIE